MLFSALLVIAGVLSSLLMVINDEMLDVFLPPKYQPFAPLILSAIGVISMGLRAITNTPIFNNGTPPKE